MNSASSARVIKLRTERMREVAPLPFDLGTLQEVCSKKLGRAPQDGASPSLFGMIQIWKILVGVDSMLYSL